MAHLHRLILAVLLVWAWPTFAATVPKVPMCKVSAGGGQFRVSSSCETAARQLEQYYSQGRLITCSPAYPAVEPCKMEGLGAGGLQSFDLGVAWLAPGCPDGSVEQGGECVSTEPPKTADQKCADLAALYNSWSWAGGREGVVDSTSPYPLDEPFQVCMSNSELGIGRPDDPPGCMHNFTPTMKGRLSDGGPWRYWGDSWMVGPVQGRACVPGLDGQPGDPPNVPPAEPQGPCKGFEGSVNGVDVCIDPSSGYTEGIDWTQVTDAQGNIKEQKTEIKCEGEKCTIQTTLKDPGSTGPGNTTTTTTTRGAYCAKNPESAVCKGADDTTGSTRNQNGRGGPGDPAGKGNGGGNGEGNGFCKENPDSPICKQGSFSGSCAASFACDGDAIQCAIAKEQHLRNCKMFDDPSPESQLYEANKGKEGNQTGDLPGNETVDIAGRIDMSNALGAGSCVSDRTVTVWGQSVALPFSAICPSLAMFGQLLVAVSLLLAARIVLRG